MKKISIALVLIFGSLLITVFLLLLAEKKDMERDISFSVNSFEGEYYEIGFKEGQILLKNNPKFKYVLKAPIFPKTTPERFEEVSKLLAEFDPEILEEMRGFADATKIPYEDILVKLSGYGFQPKIGCTQIAVLPEITSNHHVIVGRNYDFSDDKKLSDWRLILLYPGTGKHSIGVSQFIFGRTEGMNNDGLYVGMSFAHGKGKNENGFFFPMVVRILLDKCRNAEEALELIQKIPHSSSYNYLIADNKSAFVAEVSPPKIVIREPQNGLIITANHYISDVMKEEQEWTMPNSVERYNIVMTNLSGISKIDIEDVKNVLSGHSKDGVCGHHYNEFLGTLWSAIFDLNELKVYYAIGAPCISEYNLIDFSDGERINKTIKGHLPPSEPFR
jgi:predicted choloylglycine hydrolase